MLNLSGIYAVWMRELKVYLREKERAISSLISPLLWIFGFGAGLGASVNISGMNYQTYVFPGIMGMTVLFTSVFYGLYVIWDRKLDFLKAVLVSPLPRSQVFIGKMLGGATDAMIQSAILFLVGIFLGIKFTPYTFFASALTLFLLAVTMTSVGLFLGAMLSSMEAFQLVGNFFIWPVFIFSGALFPISNLPGWLQTLTYIDPMTYAVDALRGAMLGSGTLPIALDLGVLALASIVVMLLGSWSFERMEQL
jgi:ABC-2 type transport system permease protein